MSCFVHVAAQRRWLPVCVLALFGLTAACTGGEEPPPPADPPMAASAKADLHHKRWRQLSADLEQALSLSREQICYELGVDVLSCTTLHKGRLKGTNWKVNLYRPIDEPTSTTGMAVERLVLQACHRRLQLDRDVATEERVVFTHVELDDDNATATLEELEAQSVELYRRLLARDPLTIEVEAMVAHHNTITDIGGTNADWARMSCFAIGTTTEALFY